MRRASPKGAGVTINPLLLGGTLMHGKDEFVSPAPAQSHEAMP